MKILVSGCSFSSGWGFKDEKLNSCIWPNILASSLGAEITNVSATGYDNQGILLNALHALSTDTFDLILIQITGLDRVVLSPNINGHRLVKNENISNGLLTEKEYQDFYKSFLVLNKPFEHWQRLLKSIEIFQRLSRSNNIKFINGLLNWDKSFFDNSSSEFMSFLLDEDSLPDDKIFEGRVIVNQQKTEIDLDLWINPFNNFLSLQRDTVSQTDCHPGPSSQKIFAEYIQNKLKL